MGRPRKYPIQTDSVSEPMREVQLDQVPQVDEIEAKVDSKTFAALQDQLDKQSALINQLLNAKQNPVTGYAEHTDEYPVAKILFIEDKPVIAYGNVRNVGDQLSIKLTLRNEDGTPEMMEADYVNMMFNGTRYSVEILKTERKEIEMHQGSIKQHVMTVMHDEMHKKTSLGRPYTPKRVLLQQTLIDDTATVRFIDGPMAGKEIKVNVNCLNP